VPERIFLHEKYYHKSTFTVKVIDIRGRSGTGGKELGPVLQEAQGAIVFIGGGNEEEALAAECTG
jgi:hypothetical protein